MAMAMNQIQFQHGLSVPEFLAAYGTERQCIGAMWQIRWPDGFRCVRCDFGKYYQTGSEIRPLYQCQKCRHQSSLTAGTVMDSSKLPLRVWFLAMYFVSQDKTGLSSLALKRLLGTSYRTAWLIHQKLMATMAVQDRREPLSGTVQLDDAYLGGERPGTPGRGSKNKVPIVAAVQTSDEGHPLRVKISAVPTFEKSAITQWAQDNLRPGTDVLSDGLACFAGVIDAGCAHSYLVVGSRKPRDLPRFRWVNTVLGNLKTMINGGLKGFDFRKYADPYLGAFSYRFNRRFDLNGLFEDLVRHAANQCPRRETDIRACGAL